MKRQELERGIRSNRNARLAVLAALGIAFAAMALAFGSSAAPVSITVPFSATSVAVAELDGDPASGAWGDALSAAIPLENGAASPYGSATLFAKHDGTYMYLRIDGSIDVPWTSSTGNHFWLGMQISPSGTSHHGSGTWDGVFFGLWDGAAYVPQAVYPPTPVDTNGFAKPPAKDASQDALGAMRFAGISAPYTFTAEWRKKLNTGDASDLTYTADGAATYNFFVTTDSDGKGSSGGALAHSRVTNTNTVKFAQPPSTSNTPPQVDLTSPNGGEVWPGGSSRPLFWNMSDAESATTALVVWINYSTDGGTTYAPIAGAQGLSGLANPCTYAWIVPSISTTQARVRVTVTDPGSSIATDSSASNFAIDSAAPTIQHTPSVQALTNTPIPISAVITDVDPIADARVDYTDVLGARSNVTMTLTGGLYEYTIPGQSAQGTLRYFLWAVDSNGNAARTPTYPVVIVATDTVPPAISSVRANPSVQDAGFAVNITASVSDNVAVQGVRIEVSSPQGASLGNVSMVRVGATTTFSFGRPYAVLGIHSFRIWAVDGSGNGAAATGSFEVVDRIAPVIESVTILPTVRETGVPVNVSAKVTDNLGVAGVRIEIRNGTGGVLVDRGMAGGAIAFWTEFTPREPGNLSLLLTATDVSGNAAASEANITVGDAPPPAPRNVLVAPIAPACLKVDWEASQALDVVEYRIYRWNRTRATFDLISNAPAEATSYTDCGLEDDTVYSYWVVAFDRYGQPSPPSPIGNGRTSAREIVSTTFDPLYPIVIFALLAGNVVFATLWAGARRRKAPERPGNP